MRYRVAEHKKALGTILLLQRAADRSPYSSVASPLGEKKKRGAYA